jgi:hypothetical protein
VRVTCPQAGEAAAAQVDEAMLANMEAAAREREAAELKKRQESKLNDYKFNADTWGTDAPEGDLDGKKVRAVAEEAVGCEGRAGPWAWWRGRCGPAACAGAVVHGVRNADPSGAGHGERQTRGSVRLLHAQAVAVAC